VSAYYENKKCPITRLFKIKFTIIYSAFGKYSDPLTLKK
jgi:hypothetical protein